MDFWEVISYLFKFSFETALIYMVVLFNLTFIASSTKTLDKNTVSRQRETITNCKWLLENLAYLPRVWQSIGEVTGVSQRQLWLVWCWYFVTMESIQLILLQTIDQITKNLGFNINVYIDTFFQLSKVFH